MLSFLHKNSPKSGNGFWKHVRHAIVCDVFDYVKDMVLGHRELLDVGFKVVRCRRCGYLWLEVEDAIAERNSLP
jgi:DNA polymerase III epsilon subunit-like protein